MVGGDLRDDLIEAGGRLLAAADRAALAPIAAAWLRDHALETWRYYLVSPLAEQDGGREVYGRAAELVDQLDGPEDLSWLDVYLVGPNHPMAELIGEAFEAGGTEPVFLPGAGVEDIGVDALVCRCEKGTPGGVPDKRVLSPEPA